MSNAREPAPPPPADPGAQVKVEHAENVNVPAMGGHLPYVRVITGVTFVILLAFALVTFWVLQAGPQSGVDAATKGSVIQTWNNLAIAAATFWVGSSLAGKMTSGRGGQ
jgi:hypothetical protein